MKVLWLTNILPHFIAKRIHKDTIANLGWLDYSAELLLEDETFELISVFPMKEKVDTSLGKIRCISFDQKYIKSNDDCKLEAIFEQILKEFRPEIVHIHGTEFIHSLAMMKAASALDLLDRTIISIQGLVSIYARHYLAGLPDYATRFFTIRNLLKRKNIRGEMNEYAKRGQYEIEAIKIAKHIIGRTEWDYACSKMYNPKIQYHFCNETLRKTFYNGLWAYEKCDKHSIFVSQSSYSIKGLHQAIEALRILVNKYPDCKLYVTGNSPFDMKWYKINSYHWYIKRILIKYGLNNHITYLGMLNENNMKDMFLKCNAFLLPSSIENSPNSLGEAMLLGVPCVVADVGGVSTVFKDKEDGLLYPFDETYMISYYVDRIFTDTDLVNNITQNARRHALRTHDPFSNKERLIEIYTKMIDEGETK